MSATDHMLPKYEVLKQWVDELSQKKREQDQLIMNLEKVITQLKAELEDLKTGSVHSCHSKCQKLECVQRREIEQLKVKLNTCKHDYWFMINLLENYSTDKDQAIKDCIERMKFRKSLFEVES